ncbi:MAG: PAS domain-containing sensor histidine kinase [Candidatus Cyclonatronum sp.]|uniref:sensor histidine kinase n=1 Tax=Cyclonatronum sp. TaxID=3024185 RepID=UPI0025C10242|nr:PAS domain-containing sensor histidine kinase [Cyclonatronum sp.]MCC5933299.1 PAS domain S-box protein [Balneolales bacterium]MCH8486845.1 PAS domain-containing sensor histidine kinase [Cyclonatronum sp.]
MDNQNDRKTEQAYPLEPFFELSHDLLCIAGFDGYFKRVNPAVCSLLGYTEAELLSEPISFFQHPDDREATQLYRENILEGKPLTNFENRYITKQGDELWFAWTSIPVQEQQLVYAIAKNITHKKKHEAERNQLLAELSNHNSRLKQLNYTTSHDLRAPVSNLISIFSLIDLSEITNEETREFIGMLQTSAENLKETLDGFVDNLKNQNPAERKLADVRIEDVIATTKKAIQTLIKDSNTSFQTDLSAFESVRFNPKYLESIFLNLISNAIKYAHPKRDPVIIIKNEITGGKKTLTFSDNGIGFDSEKQKDKVFGLNQTFHKNKDSKGIGLYLVKTHMAEMGGQITVESRVNAGTTFKLVFRD